jgi:Tfp pilus assembly protein PilO
MVKLLKNNKLILYAAIAINIILIGLLVLLNYSALKKQSDIQQKRTQLLVLKQDLLALDNVIADKNGEKNRIDMVLNSLPKSYEEIAYYTEVIEKISEKNSQVLETKIDNKAKDENQGLVSLKYSIKTTGNYSSYSQMLSDLSNLPYHIRIDSLKIENQKGKIVALTNFRLYILEP